MRAESQHKFTAIEDDWGFAEFVKIDALTSDRDGFMPDGKLHIKVKLRVKLEEKYTGMTRQVTGYVGLKNQVSARLCSAAPATHQQAVEWPLISDRL